MIVDLSDEVVVVTGGGGSIGSAIATELAASGATVVVADNSITAARTVVSDLERAGFRALALEMDVRDSHSVDGAIRTAAEILGSLTGLVNAAGILRTGPLEEMSDASWDEIMNVNVHGTFRATRAALTQFRKGGRGNIVNLSSVSAFIGSDEGAAYTTTKGAVLSFTYATAGELAAEGFRVNAVCPGWVDGGFTHEAMRTASDPGQLIETAKKLHYLGRMATPTDVANAVVWLMSSRASFITGTAILVDGGFMIRHGA